METTKSLLNKINYWFEDIEKTKIYICESIADICKNYPDNTVELTENVYIPGISLMVQYIRLVGNECYIESVMGTQWIITYLDVVALQDLVQKIES